MDKLDMRFAKRIMDEEWPEFEAAGQDAIEQRTKRVSGTLRNEHGNRKYSVSGGTTKVVAKYQHPDYERFLDMRKTSRTQKKVSVFTDRDKITRQRKGRSIHNAVIFGRLNPISFRLMHDLRVEVREEVRNNFSSGTVSG